MKIAVSIGSEFFRGSGSTVFTGSDLTGISTLVSLFLKGSLALAGVILLFYLVASGIAMIGSAGKDDPKTSAQAKQTFTSAIIGFIVVLTAYWIVTLVGNLFGITGII